MIKVSYRAVLAVLFLKIKLLWFLMCSYGFIWLILSCNDLAQRSHIEDILPKGPYLPCLHMADRALLAGYPRFMHQRTRLPFIGWDKGLLALWCWATIICCQLDHREQTPVKWDWKANLFLKENAYEIMVCKIAAILFRPCITQHACLFRPNHWYINSRNSEALEVRNFCHVAAGGN